jgi:hypothetical protein
VASRLVVADFGIEGLGRMEFGQRKLLWFGLWILSTAGSGKRLCWLS